MANDLNQCNFIGRLGKDPELRFMPSGGAVANFSIAVSNQWKDKTTGNNEERTAWIRIVAFNRLAEIIGDYCHKGSKVFVTGEYRTRKWEKDGIDQYTTEIVARELQMLDSRSDAPTTASQAHKKAAAAPGQNAAEPFDDDIPF